MTLAFDTSFRTLANTAAALLLATAAPWALAAPTPQDDLAAKTVDAQPAPARLGGSCRPMSAARADGAGRETPTQDQAQRAAGESQQLALGQTHCWWACYPGSGCDYICNYFPQ